MDTPKHEPWNGANLKMTYLLDILLFNFRGVDLEVMVFWGDLLFKGERKTPCIILDILYLDILG